MSNSSPSHTTSAREKLLSTTGTSSVLSGLKAGEELFSGEAVRQKEVLYVKLMTARATPPRKGYPTDAGYDLSSAVDTTVPAGGSTLIPTDLAVAIPNGYYGRVASRSGLAVKNGIEVGAGVIDRSFRGIVSVLLRNWSDKDFQVKVGDRIAQLILEKIANAEVVQVEFLPPSDRGIAGFGSTGLGIQLP